MEKIILLFCLSIIAVNLCSQTQVQWAPPEVVWTYELSGPFMNPSVHRRYYKLYNPHDTIVAGEVATTFDYVMGSIEPWLVEEGMENNPDFLPPIIKQEGRKVYRFLRNQFHLLYDFDAEVGDTLSIVIDQLDRPQDSLTYLKVVEKALVDVEGKEVLGLKLQAIELGNFKFSLTFEGWHYEGIGSAQYFNPYNPLVCDYFCVRALRCYIDSTVSINLSDIGCEEIVIHSNTSEFDTKEAEINVFPNPLNVGHRLSIEVKGELLDGLCTMVLFDLSGRQIWTGQAVFGRNGSTSIYLNNVEPGLYFLAFHAEKSKKVMKLQIIE